jgi:tetratricopeptide (TPR) repeat protein
MDAYDLPGELGDGHCLNMAEITFLEDIQFSVKRKMDAGKAPEKSATAAVVAATPVAPGVESLMKRGWLFLEDSDWKQANEYFDRVLDIDPEYAPAYAGKLCAELKVRREEALPECNTPFADNDYEFLWRLPPRKLRWTERFADVAGFLRAFSRRDAGLKRAYDFLVFLFRAQSPNFEATLPSGIFQLDR